MISRIQAIFTGCFRHSNHKSSTVQDMEAVRSRGISSTTDIMDTTLFTYYHDFWLAKVVFQFLFAMVVQDEDLERLCINPKDVLAQVEYGYMENSGENLGSNGNLYYPGSILFKRINAARAAKNEKAFKIFLDDLSTHIEQSCQILRKGVVAELDAGPTSNRIHRFASSMCAAINNPSSEGNVGQNTILSKSNLSPPSVPCREELPLHTYSTLLKEYVAKSGISPQRIPRLDGDSLLWYYEITLDGVRGVGEGVTKKDAERMASRDICRALNIGSG